jgi:calcineurin-like phosphoesterase family protein
MSVYFTSDTHFSHRGIIDYCERPYTSVEEMDEALIKNWNSIVGQNDTIYHMGDFSFCGLTRTREILAQLNGHKILIRGNHDKNFFRKDGTLKDLPFEATHNNLKINLSDGTLVTLSHYQYLGHADLDGRDFTSKQVEDDGGYLLHGHVHRGWQINGRMINVGIDVWGYTPVCEKQILDIIYK